MMTTLSSYVRRGRHTLHRLSLDPRVHRAAKLAGSALAGFALSAASLSHSPQPFALGLLLSQSGWQAAALALGGAAGYLFFWGAHRLQGAAWMVLGLAGALAGIHRQYPRRMLLSAAFSALIVAATGLAFQLWELDDVAVPIYLLRLGCGAGAGALFAVTAVRRDAIADWLASAVAVLALAQIAPVPWLNLGCVAAGALSVAGAFPAAALAGLALDLAQVSRVPMTAVLCLTYLLRLLPRVNQKLLRLSPGFVHLLVMALTGLWDPTPLPALALGGLLGPWLPGQKPTAHRRGETGVAQVRLEMAASVLAESERILLEAPEQEIDEEALLLRSVERACGSCPCRKTCRDRSRMTLLSPTLLHRPLLSPGDMGTGCRKSGRVLQELHRSQEQLRAIKAGRERQAEYRGAVIQQYRFLSEYLQNLSDALSDRERTVRCRYSVKVTVYANRQPSDNGDRCIWFAGTEGNYYVLLCDGMGTGLGAVDEGRTAAALLKQILCAGFPPEYALASINSLCALRDRAGAVTVDLLRIRLDTGRCWLYKWGAAPSVLLTEAGAEKIGTAGPPPGLSVTDTRETVTRLSLRRGETLVLLSDGVRGEEIPHLRAAAPEATPGELATRLLEQEEGTDDATLALVRLEPSAVST